MMMVSLSEAKSWFQKEIFLSIENESRNLDFNQD